MIDPPHGVVPCICAGDLKRFAPMLKATVAVFFCGGVAGLVSWSILGAPSSLLMALGAIELVAPVVLGLRFARACRVVQAWSAPRRPAAQPMVLFV